MFHLIPDKEKRINYNHRATFLKPLMDPFIVPSIKRHISYIRGEAINSQPFLYSESGKYYIMISLILLPTCTTLLTVQLLMGPTQAFKRTSNVDEYLVEDQRTRLRQNYILQRALNNGMHKNKIGLTYVKKPLDSNTNPEELPELIVDYADMIRNDIILLDNSVETRTRKRGKVEKFDQDGVPCTCEYETKENIFLGHDYYPASLETYKCNHKLCPPPYRCLERVHNITVLRRKRDLDDFNYEELSQEKLPADLKRWVGIKTPVTVGCMCTRNYSNRT